MDRQLGFQFDGGLSTTIENKPATRQINTRHALWGDRWPAIAKQECIDKVEATPPDHQSEVKFHLPCSTCELSAQCLNAKGKEVGTLLYDREFLTNPRSSESSLFPRELMAPMLDMDLEFLPAYTRNPVRKQAIYQAWDLAWSEKTGGDYLVCMTAMVDVPTGLSQLLYLERWQRLGFDAQCKLIEAKWRQYKADMVVIESDAAQSIWWQHLAATTNVPVVRHDSSGKKDLAHGVPSMLIRFQNRKWRFPFKQGSWLHDEMENLLTELEAFGWEDGKLQGVGEHDDTVMCLWHLDWIIKGLVYGTENM
jgi:phage terminase large subunit-like protein